MHVIDGVKYYSREEIMKDLRVSYTNLTTYAHQYEVGRVFGTMFSDKDVRFLKSRIGKVGRPKHAG